MATSRRAYACLWQFCFGIDLKSSIEAPNRPVDDALMWMVADPRRLQRTTEDGKWLRLVDGASGIVEPALLSERISGD